MATPLEQHNLEIHENFQRWQQKPLLRRVYSRFYQEIASQLTSQIDGHTLELGSGIGQIKSHIPHCITSDLFANEWLDRSENAYHLSFDNACISNLILFDVWHHLEFPGVALQEFARVVKPSGRLILFEPAMGLLGRFIYGNFHHEPLGLNEPITWEPRSPNDFVERYYAAQGNAWRLFMKKEAAGLLGDWSLRTVRTQSGLAYTASGGFRGPQLYPEALLPVIEGMDRVLSLFPSLFATRMLVVLDRH